MMYTMPKIFYQFVLILLLLLSEQKFLYIRVGDDLEFHPVRRCGNVNGILVNEHKFRLSLKLDWLFSVGTSFRFAVFEVIEPSGVPQNGSEGRFPVS